MLAAITFLTESLTTTVGVLTLPSYVKDVLEYPACTEDMICGPIIVPKDHYFMMGDNRGHSRDSRYFGFVHKSRFIGKAKYVARFHKL